MAEVKKAFNPEFLNRLDETILFTSLSDDDLLKIIASADRPDQQEPGSQADQDPAERRRGQVYSGEDLHGPQLRRAAAAAGASEVYRRSAQRGSDSRRRSRGRPSSRCTWAKAVSTAASFRSSRNRWRSWAMAPRSKKPPRRRRRACRCTSLISSRGRLAIGRRLATTSVLIRFWRDCLLG